MKSFHVMLSRGVAVALSLQVASAATVLFDLHDFTTTATAHRKVIISPVGVTLNGTQIIHADSLLRTSDTYGQIWISNCVPGVYNVEITAPPRRSSFNVTVPETNGVLNAAQLVSVGTNAAAGGQAYSMATSDTRFVGRSEPWAVAPGTGLTGTTNGPVVTLNATGEALPADLLAATQEVARVTGQMKSNSPVWLSAGSNIVLETTGEVTTVHSTASGSGETPTSVEDADFVGRTYAGWPLDLPTFDGLTPVVHPDVLLLDDPISGFKWWMAMTPYPDSTRENPSVLCSTNGVDWEVPPNATNYLFGSHKTGWYTADPQLLQLTNGQLALFWIDNGVVSPTVNSNKLMRATSATGTNWSAALEVLTGAAAGGATFNLISPTIVSEANGTLRMWTYGMASNSVQIWTSSTLGSNWTWVADATNGNGTAWLPWHLDVVRVGSTYYSIDSRGGSWDKYLSTGVSSNGYSWDVDMQSIPATTNRWAEGWYRASLVTVQTDPPLFDIYAGSSHNILMATNNPGWRIGLMRGVSLTNILPTLKIGNASDYYGNVTLLSGSLDVRSLSADQVSSTSVRANDITVTNAISVSNRINFGQVTIRHSSNTLRIHDFGNVSGIQVLSVSNGILRIGYPGPAASKGGTKSMGDLEVNWNKKLYGDGSGLSNLQISASLPYGMLLTNQVGVIGAGAADGTYTYSGAIPGWQQTGGDWQFRADGENGLQLGDWTGSGQVWTNWPATAELPWEGEWRVGINATTTNSITVAELEGGETSGNGVYNWSTDAYYNGDWKIENMADTWLLKSNIVTYYLTTSTWPWDVTWTAEAGTEPIPVVTRAVTAIPFVQQSIAGDSSWLTNGATFYNPRLQWPTFPITLFGSNNNVYLYDQDAGNFIWRSSSGKLRADGGITASSNGVTLDWGGKYYGDGSAITGIVATSSDSYWPTGTLVENVDGFATNTTFRASAGTNIAAVFDGAGWYSSANTITNYFRNLASTNNRTLIRNYESTLSDLRYAGLLLGIDDSSANDSMLEVYTGRSWAGGTNIYYGLTYTADNSPLLSFRKHKADDTSYFWSSTTSNRFTGSVYATNVSNYIVGTFLGDGSGLSNLVSSYLIDGTNDTLDTVTIVGDSALNGELNVNGQIYLGFDATFHGYTGATTNTYGKTFDQVSAYVTNHTDSATNQLAIAGTNTWQAKDAELSEWSGVGTNAVAGYATNAAKAWGTNDTLYAWGTRATNSYLQTNCVGTGLIYTNGVLASTATSSGGGSGSNYFFTNIVVSGTTTLLTFGANGTNISTDCTLGNHYRCTLTNNFQLNNPTSPLDGQRVVWELIQDATGSRTLAVGDAFAFGSDITALTLSTTASKRDFITAVYNSTASKWYVVGFVRGY